MKTQELRLGNLIYNTKGEVDDVDMDALKYMLTYPDPLCQAKPIPLTEEWFLRFGFDGMFSGAGYHKDGVEIGYNYNGYYVISTGFKIKYVHQLQNLYFALTGEELTIKDE